MKLQKFFVIFFLLLVTIQIATAANLTIDKVYEKVTGTEITSYKFYVSNTTLVNYERTIDVTNETTSHHDTTLYTYTLTNYPKITSTQTEMYTSASTGYLYQKYTYLDGSTAYTTNTSYDGAIYTYKTINNPYPDKIVTKIEYIGNIPASTMLKIRNSKLNETGNYTNKTYNQSYKSNDLTAGTYCFHIYNTSNYLGTEYCYTHNAATTKNITGNYNAIATIYFTNNYTSETINDVNYSIGSYTSGYNATGTASDYITLNWTNTTNQANGSVSIMYNPAQQNITINAGTNDYYLSFTPIAIYIEFSAITNITVYHVDGINVTANNNSIYIYQDELPIGRTTISWNNDTQKIMYYNTRSDVFSAEMYVYPNLDSSMLDAPRRFKILEDGVESSNARIFIEMQNGTEWKGFMGGLTGENGLTDIELIGGLTYRYTVFKEGYDSATGIFNTVAPPTGSEVETFIINIYSTSDGSDSELTSGCLGTVKKDSICYYSLICGETTTCYYTITKRTYTNGTAYTEVNYTGSTLGTVTGTWNTSNTTYKETITATIDTDPTDETPATNVEPIYIAIQTDTRNATYAPIKITDIRDPDNYKIWFIVLLLVGVIVGIFMETRVLTGSGVYGMAAIWGLSSVWLPSMMIPFVIVAAPKLAIEIWKRLN